MDSTAKSQGAASLRDGLAAREASREASPLERALELLAELAGSMPRGNLEQALASRKPSFRDSDLRLLSALAAALVEPNPPGAALAWAERLLVFVEVRRTELRPRLRAKWPAPRERLLGALALRAVLATAFAGTGDLRFLNTALKLDDSTAVVELRLRCRWRSSGTALRHLDQLLQQQTSIALGTLRVERP